MDLRREHARFIDYWLSVPGARGRKLDWPATWRNWMRTAWDNHEARQRRAGGGQRMGTDERVQGWMDPGLIGRPDDGGDGPAAIGGAR